ncbi:hypothetical protein BU204_05500 [Actinophytocola xanthii]|uniref:Uncharacterized protein n=1 Tax=Actinophytocola xanthii TaxID=1912961 RepID=A0A1Q8CW50_9PSEU|nr:hypothetical protein BU204_05500 [Actinophytocola xanthii]
MPDGTQPEPDQHEELSATRHLCTGVYLDRSFRNLVIRKVHNDPRRRVAPSYGFDLVPVVRHAWRAWALDLALHVAIVATLLAGLLTHQVVSVLTLLCVFSVYLLVLSAGRDLLDLLRLRVTDEAERWRERPERRGRFKDMERKDRGKLRLKVQAVACVALAVGPPVVASRTGDSLGATFPETVLLAGVIMSCAVVVGVLRQLQLNANQSAGSLRPRTLTRREKTIDEQQDHPCVVYRRPPTESDVDPLDLLTEPQKAPSPFVGAGALVNRWLPPMTIQLLRRDLGATAVGLAQREHSTPPFQAHELVNHLKGALEQLTHDAGNEGLPGLRVRDRLYVADTDLSANRQLLGDDLAFTIRRIIDNPLALAHHFLETSVPIAGGELVTTVFIRVSLKGRCLSLDVGTCALTRTNERFHVVDRYAEHGMTAIVRSAFRALGNVPKDVFHSWHLLETPGLLAGAVWSKKDRTRRPRRGVPVGPRVVVREAVADGWHRAELDRTAIYDHMKIIEQRIIKAAMDFLAQHDVDTSAFERQATNIINSGTLNMGGVNTFLNSALGASAKAMVGAAQEIQAAAREKAT